MMKNLTVEVLRFFIVCMHLHSGKPMASVSLEAIQFCRYNRPWVSLCLNLICCLNCVSADWTGTFEKVHKYGDTDTNQLMNEQ